jgi:transcriptional regulator with XRE-family HTH domain
MKKQHITQEELAGKLYITRTTLNNYLSGKVMPPDEMKRHLYACLKLSAQEAMELDYEFCLGQFDEAEMAAWRAIDSTLFEPPPQPDEYYCYFYSGSRVFYQSSQEMLDKVFATKNSKLTYEFTILNCMSPDVLPRVRLILERLCGDGIAASVSHFINPTHGNVSDRMQAFLNFCFRLPLQRIRNYNVLLDIDMPESYISKRMLFEDSAVLVVNDTGKKSRKYYWFTFLDNGESSVCLLPGNSACEFLDAGLQNYTERFTDSAVRRLNEGELLAEIDAAEQYDTMLIKPDIGYQQISPEAYRMMRDRCLDSLGTEAIIGLGEIAPNMDAASAADYFIGYEARRFAYSQEHNQMNICSMAGMRRFARSGLLSGHMPGMPRLSKDELRVVLTTLRERSADPHDPYQLYLTRRDMCGRNFMIEASGDGSVFTELNDSRKGLLFGSVSLRKQELARVLFDYARHWQIPRYAVSAQEADRFLGKLIEEL